MIINDLNFRKSYKINRSSDQNTFYMKVDQKNTTDTDTPSVCPPPPLSYRTSTFPPPGCLSKIPGVGINLSG